MEHIVVNNKNENIVIPVAKSYSDCIVLIQSDFFRHYGYKLSFLKMWLMSYRNASLSLSFWLRLSSYKGWFYFYSRLRLAYVSQKYGLQIHPTTKIGYGLYIGHGFGTIINPNAVIGNNVNLSQFTTIGSNKSKSAIIGNNVYVGPSVCIVEDVSIGSNACIGAGSVVVKDVPASVTVAGVPAKVISENTSERFVNRRYLFDD